MKVGLFIKGKYGWIVSTSERLQCYAYTACTIILVLPGGYKIEDICSPAEHISIQKVFPLDDKQTGKDSDDKQLVDSVPGTATPLGSNPLHLLGSTQVSDAPHSQRCVVSKVAEADGEMSPTLPWPNHDLKNIQVDNQQSSHLGDRTHRPFEPATDDSKFGIADSRPHNYPSTRCNGGGLDDESAKDTKGVLPLSQPDRKGGQLGLIKPHAEVFSSMCWSMQPAFTSSFGHQKHIICRRKTHVQNL